MPYADLNRGRRSIPNQLYCVTVTTRDRSLIFHDFNSSRRLCAEMRSFHESGTIYSIAWVIMPDHLHWLFQLAGNSHLWEVMKAFKGRSSRRIGASLGRKGGIWQRAYYDRAIRREEDIRVIARYIVANPLRAGLVQHIGDYPHWDCIWL